MLEVGCQLIDFDRREAGDRDVKPLDHQDLRELRQLDGQQLAVPARIFSDFVVGKREGTPLCFRQALYLEDRDLLEVPAALPRHSGRGRQ